MTFLDNLLKMQNTKNVNWLIDLKLSWISSMLSKRLQNPTLQPFTKNGDQCIICWNMYGIEGMW